MKNFSLIIFFSLITILVYLNATFFPKQEPDVFSSLEERIAPLGKVNIAPPLQAFKNTYPSLIQQGEIVYKDKCILCHEYGVAGAPRIGKEADWKLRVKKKLSLLLNHVAKGYRAMPPKGACLECTNEDLKAAVNYMLEQL